jgi:hypothetical protein
MVRLLSSHIVAEGTTNMKTRYYVNPSSLGSYFGCGFLSPDEQIQIDLGQAEQEFDEAAQDRMDWGRFLEDGALNFFENKFKCKIEERNDHLLELYDGKIHGKVDGVTVIDGKRTVVENKISNAQYKFTEAPGYLFQVQSYMIDGDYEQCLLCGSYQGRPIYKMIQPDLDMIADIKEMTDFVVDVMMGVADFDENYPEHLLAKYSNVHKLTPIENVSDQIQTYWTLLGNLNKSKAEIEKTIKDLNETYAEFMEELDGYADGKFENDFIKVTVGTYERKGALDADALSLDYPKINYTKYMKPASTYKVTKIKVK